MLKNSSNQNGLLNYAKLMGLVSLGLLAGCIAEAGPEIPLEEGIGEAKSAFSVEICDGIDNDGDFLMAEDPNDSENGGACKPKINKSVHDNHEYLFVDREFAWDTAHAVCKGRGFDLAKIDNAAAGIPSCARCPF